ncbi:MAG TPA: tannase/feruloyl esterase family alpha/beta hydrolase [Verrucomicrobia bacterium]|nr:tannase/feruloyl esterase family alpha/beta hydrolase [Verrucomicrobiota bacterium]
MTVTGRNHVVPNTVVAPALRGTRKAFTAARLAVVLAFPFAAVAAELIPAPGSKLPPLPDKVITAADVTVERLGTNIPASAIGEPVGGVTLSPPRWIEATGNAVAHAIIDGSIAPKDPNGKPINFRVLLPARWSRRAIQVGGGGMNGMVPMLRGERPDSPTATFARYGSDSGHQMGGFGGFGRGGGGGGNDWALNEEAIRNLGYMQMKKTHDAAMVIMERIYGERPRFNYYIGSSQGGREALTVAQRYPADYDGVVADVPIVSFSTLMLAPELIRIQEKPLSNWVTRAKINAIRAEFMRQADKLDGLADGVINNYMAARALFDMSQGDPNRNPWAALRGPDGTDPNPQDTSINARLTDGQIETLKMVYSRYKFATPLANGVTSFGMWVPNTDPGGSGLIVDRRFRGQEGADENAPIHSHMGVLGVTGFLMQDLSANPLDYVEGGPLNKRRELLSEWLDSTNPDLSAFYRRGGKMIVTIGTDDTLASPGAQLDYFQSVIDKMGRDQVDAFARFYVLPQTGHGLSGRSASINGDGKEVTPFEIPNRFDRIALITAWVERNEPPGKTVIVTAGGRSLPMCSYPNYPRYKGGPPESADSYESTAP